MKATVVTPIDPEDLNDKEEQRRLIQMSAEQSQQISSEIDELIKKFERYKVTFSADKSRDK